MTFLNPTLAFAGLAAVSIPIVIHVLMRRRRRAVMWGAMRFLLEAYRKQRRRLRLEQLLLLAARCLVVALVAVALGRPLLGAGGALSGHGATTLYLLVDNSLASGAVDDEGKAAIERSAALAVEVLGGLDASMGDRAGLIWLGGPAEGAVVPASSDLGAIRALVEGARPVESAADLPGAALMLHDEVSRQEAGGRTVVAVLGGFFAGSGTPEAVLMPVADAGGAPVAVMASRPEAEGASNVAITGVEPLRSVVLAGDAAETPNQVRVFLRRFGPGVSEAGISKVRVRIAREGEIPSAIAEPAEQVVRWSPGQSEAVAAVATGVGGGAGEGMIVAEIDRDAVAGDNLWRRPVQVRESLRIGLIAPRQSDGRGGLDPGNSADWLRLALTPTDVDRQAWRGRTGEIEVVGIEPGGVDASRLSGLDVAVVAAPDLLTVDAWRRLRALVDGGGVVMVVPPGDSGAHLWTDAFVREMGLAWTIGREPADLGEASLSAQRDPGGDLLSLVASELPELVKPVRVRRALPLTVDGAVERVLTLTDGTPWIVAASPGEGEKGEGSDGRMPVEQRGERGGPVGGRGLVVLMASSLAIEWTDLAGKPLFVPLVQELIRQGVGRARPAWSEVAGTRIGAPARAAELRPDAIGGGEEGGAALTVDATGRSVEAVRRVGAYRALDDRGVTRGLVAVNADTRGSATEAQDAERIASWLGTLGHGAVRWLDEAGDDSAAGAVMAARATDDSWSLPLLLAALAVGIAELCMARWFSHAGVLRGEGVPA